MLPQRQKTFFPYSMESEPWIQVLWTKAKGLPLKEMFESLVNFKSKMDVPLVPTPPFPDIYKCTKLKEDALCFMNKSKNQTLN